MNDKYKSIITGIFDDNGDLASNLKDYRSRPSQIKMALQTADALFKEKHVAIEAGTGIGKSLAYLVPSILYAVSEGKRGAISTETRTLQNQLVSKEIPLLQQIMLPYTTRKIKIEICLGSGNYLCLRKYDHARASGVFNKHELKKIHLIDEAVENNNIITRIDGTLPESIWKHIHRDKDFCLRSKCPHFGYCMLQQARLRWNSADLLIMNHYLYFTHINTGKTYLPYFDFAVFDEAHAVPEICCKQLGFSIDSDYFRHDTSPEEIHKTIQSIKDPQKRDRLLDLFTYIRDEYRYFFDLLTSIAKDNNSFRITKPIASASFLSDALKRFIDISGKIEEDDCDEYTLFMIDGIRARLLPLHSAIDMITRKPADDWVFWIENSNRTLFNGQPIESSKIFDNDIFSFYSSLVFSSATLTVNNSFDFFLSRITDINRDKMEFLKLDSEFDYKKNLVVHLNRDKINPSDKSYAKHITEIITKCAKITNGNVLILFNSYRLLNLCEDILCQQEKYPVISQSEFSAIEAVTLYRKENNALLLGTHSFWQGIDLQGDLLKAVIITQLPFTPPDRPNIEARTKIIEKRGENPFELLHLPSAVIKFRQGVGRLLRSENDYGILVILDGRITQKSYGKLFYESLPDHQTAETLQELKMLYNARKTEAETGTQPQ